MFKYQKSKPHNLSWKSIKIIVFVFVFRTIHAHLLFHLKLRFGEHFHFVQYKTIKKGSLISSYLKIFEEKLFLKFWAFINLPWGHVRSTTNLGPIGLAVLTFIGYKQTNKQSIIDILKNDLQDFNVVKYLYLFFNETPCIKYVQDKCTLCWAHVKM